MKVAWFDCTGGASGDMLLGALLDAGASLDTVSSAVRAVVGSDVELGLTRVVRHGLAAAKAQVTTAEEPTARTWVQVRDLIEAADLPAPVRTTALAVFGALAEAEGRVHGIDPAAVHFHEVGALDAVADVVGTVAALHDLEVGRVHCSAIALGSGTARSAHGLIPVPVPAVVALLGAAGAPVHAGSAEVELCTPTGAALIATLADRFGGLPALRLTSSGTGAGSRDLPGRPNVVRVLLGEHGVVDSPASGDSAGDPDEGPVPDVCTVIEATVDDLDPRIWPEVITRLLAAGAADTWLVPVLMKKGRPGSVLTVLCDPGRAGALRQVVFAETSTLGLREHTVTKHELERSFVSVVIGGTAVAVKLGLVAGRVVNVQPEFADVLAASEQTGRAVKDVLAAAGDAARAQLAGTQVADPPLGGAAGPVSGGAAASVAGH